ncbi:DMT family transporter [Nocardioidaceae bacterium]|nr:DMT family transporter [Nocardioidaceae bacterium]
MPAGSGAWAGLVVALVSAAAFGLSGAVAKPLLEAGWSAGAVVVARVGLGALVLALPALRALRGRWGLLAAHVPLVLGYAVLAVAVVQLAFFSAVRTIPVGVALLLEYLGPVLVVIWAWIVHGRRPDRLTWTGGAVALAGLALVLDLAGVGPMDMGGVAWALLAAVGLAGYFIMSADSSPLLPPVVLAAAGMAVGAVLLLVAGLVGVVPLAASSDTVAYAGVVVPVWVPILALGAVCGATAYATGIVASRRLGSRLASFVALSEVLFAMLFAWALLGELPRPVQVVGGVVVLGGVLVVRLGQAREQLREQTVTAGPGTAPAPRGAAPAATPPPARRAVPRARRGAWPR